MKYSLLKRISAFVLAFALVMTTAFNAVGTTQANAAKKATVSAKGATVTVGASKSIKVSIKCKAKAKATIKVAVVKGATGKVTKKVTNSNAKKAAKTCKSTIKVTGKKAGKVKLSITPYINGKKAGKAKKITVTVKAKATTEAATTTTEAAPTAVKLEKINVSAADTKISEKGGQTKITVTSGTVGAEIIKTTFKSSNDQFATVDEDGVVTGVNPGTVTITVSAQDKNDLNNIVTGTVSIVVSELLKSTVTLTAEDQKLDMLVGDTHKIAPIIKREDGSTPEPIFESSDTTVATVSADGTVKAVGQGSATITVKDKGTNGLATSTVTVTAEGLGITSANAVHADEIQVILNKSVATTDRANVAIALTKSSVAITDVTASYDTTGRVYSFKSKNGAFAEGDYEVSVSSPNNKIRVSTNKEELKKTIAIKKQTATTFEIKKGQIVPYSEFAKIFYTVKDQYGDAMDVVANDIDWSIEAKNSKIKFDTTSTGVFGNASNKTNKAYVLVNLSAQSVAGGAKPVLDNTSDEEILIGGEVKANKDAKDSTSFKVQAVKIQSAKIDSVNTVDASGNAIKSTDYAMTQDTSKNTKLSLNWSGVDEFGAAVDPEVYDTGSYSSIIDFSASTGDVTVDGLNADDKGKLDVTVKPNVSTDFDIIVKVGLNKTTYTIHVNPAATTSAVQTASGESTKAVTVHEGAAVEVPIKFIDQYGKDTKPGYANLADVKKVFNVTTLNGKDVSNYGSDDISLAYNTVKAGTLTFNAPNLNPGKTSGSFELSVTYFGQQLKNGKYPAFTLTVNVTPAATAKYLSTYGKFGQNVSVIQGQPVTLDFFVQDTDKAPWTTADAHYFASIEDKTDGSVATASLVSLARSSKKVNGDDKPEVANVWNGSLSFKDTTSISAFADGRINVTLYKSTDNDFLTPDDNTKLETLTYTVSLSKKPHHIAMSADKTEYTAGQTVTLTLTAQDADNNKVSTYNGVNKSCVVTETSSGKTTTFNRDVTFVNGVATVTVTAAKVTAAAKEASYSLAFNGGDGFATTALVEDLTIKVGTYKELHLYNAAGVITVKGYDGTNEETLSSKEVFVEIISDSTDVTKAGLSTGNGVYALTGDQTVVLNAAGEFYVNLLENAKLTVTYSGVKGSYTNATGGDITGAEYRADAVAEAAIDSANTAAAALDGTSAKWSAWITALGVADETISYYTSAGYPTSGLTGYATFTSNKTLLSTTLAANKTGVDGISESATYADGVAIKNAIIGITNYNSSVLTSATVSTAYSEHKVSVTVKFVDGTTKVLNFTSVTDGTGLTADANVLTLS